MRVAARCLLPVLITFVAGASYVSANQIVLQSSLGMAPRITITAPRGGETFTIGGVMAINWEYAGDVGKTVQILLYKGAVPAGTVFPSVTLDAGGKCARTWRIPEGTLPGPDYSIVVCGIEKSAIKGRSNLFTLAGPASGVSRGPALQTGVRIVNPGAIPLILVNQPAGGEVWQPGTSHDISWTNKSGRNDIKVSLALMKGDVVQSLIAADVPVGNGTKSWPIPASLAEGPYRIHIACTTDEKIFGTSEVFAIVKPAVSFAPIPACLKDWANYCTCYSVNSTACTTVPLAWSYKGLDGKLVTLTFKPDVKGDPMVIAADIPIGANGKGAFNWVLASGQTKALKTMLCNVLVNNKGTGESHWGVQGSVELKVVGTGLTAMSGKIVFLRD